MAKSRFLQNNFVSGELSPLLRGRTDINQYYQGLQTAKNVVLVPQGGVKRRPGTQHIGIAPEKIVSSGLGTMTMPNGGTPATLRDNDDTTTTSTTVGISTTNPYVVAQQNFVSARTIVFIDLRRISLSAGTSSEFKIQKSQDGIAWTDAVDVPLIGTNPQDFRFYLPELGLSTVYWRLARIGTTDLTTTTVTMAGFGFMVRAGGIVDPSEAKLIDFSVETDRNYLLVLTDQNINIYKNPGTYVASVKMPFTSEQVGTVRDTQTESVMLLFHEDVPTQRLINLGTDEDWFLDAAPYTNVPTYDFDDDLSPTPVNEVQNMVISGGSLQLGDTFQVDVEGILSKNITFAGDATADQRDSTVFNIQKNLQEMPSFGETGVAVARTGVLTYQITISGESTKDFELFSGFLPKVMPQTY